MRGLFLLLIRLYLKTIPSARRHRCVFKESCPDYIYRETEKSLRHGLQAFDYRYKRCRPGYLLFRNPLQDNPELLLVTGEVLNKDQIADEIITPDGDMNFLFL